MIIKKVYASSVAKLNSSVYDGGGDDDTLALQGYRSKNIVCGYVRNPTADFYKAIYGRDKSRFKWDYPLGRGAYPYQEQLILDLPQTSKLQFSALCPKLEFGGALLLKSGSEEFNCRLTRLLTGINCDFTKLESSL